MNTISLGVVPIYIILPILLLIVVAGFIALVVASLKSPKYTSYGTSNREGYAFIAFCAGLFLLLPIGAGSAFAFAPYDSKYYQHYEVSGTVTSVSNVIEDASGEFTSSPVITLDNGDIPIVVNDPRIVTFQDRDVTLLCTVTWKYLAEDQWDCQIREAGY